MSLLTVHAQLFWVSVLVAAVMMMRAGLAKRQLLVRRSVGPCPSCGRNRRTQVCAYCTRR
jgi:hypothetical protein